MRPGCRGQGLVAGSPYSLLPPLPRSPALTERLHAREAEPGAASIATQMGHTQQMKGIIGGCNGYAPAYRPTSHAMEAGSGASELASQMGPSPQTTGLIGKCNVCSDQRSLMLWSLGLGAFRKTCTAIAASQHPHRFTMARISL